MNVHELVIALSCVFGGLGAGILLGVFIPRLVRFRCGHQWQHMRCRGTLTLGYTLSPSDEIDRKLSGLIHVSMCLKCGKRKAQFHSTDRTYPVSVEYAIMLTREHKDEWDVEIESERKKP